MSAVEPVPSGFPTICPYLAVDGADAAIAFYTEVFGATERVRMGPPGGPIGHAELAIGNAVLMLADEHPDMGSVGPKKVGGTSVTLTAYVPDVDDAFARALARGATELRPVENQFYGDRSGQFLDPFGHRWNVATHVEDVPMEEMKRRAAEAFGDA